MKKRKLTTEIPMELDNKLAEYCTRMDTNKTEVVIRALKGVMRADQYCLYVASKKAH